MKTFEWRCGCGQIIRGFPSREAAKQDANSHSLNAGAGHRHEPSVRSTYTNADYLADRKHRERAQ